jgi:hypothetical protein
MNTLTIELTATETKALLQCTGKKTLAAAVETALSGYQKAVKASKPKPAKATKLDKPTKTTNKKPSPAQIAARKKFAERAKAGTLKGGKKGAKKGKTQWKSP